MLKNFNQIKSGHAFKDHRQERQILVSRVIFAFIMVFVLMLALLVRAWYLQVIKHEDYQTRSNNNRISVQPVAPNRGLIYDRNGVLLAENRSVYSLEIIPEQVIDLDLTLYQIKNLELVEEKHIERFKQRLEGVRRFKNVLLKSRLTEEDVAIFSANGHRLKGVRVEARLVRYYPFGDKIAHALGSVRRINDQDLLRIDQVNYRATRHMGKVGLEKHYEDILHGKIGSRTVETDVQGRVIGAPLKETPPVPGQDLKLSIDINLQLAAVEAIKEFRGAVVAIDPRNGEVLVLVSNPGYDPNDFVTGISTENYAKLTSSEDEPLFNRAVRGQYSPGSTIKPLLAWTGLENKIITKETSIDDPGYWVIPTKEQRKYGDWKKGGHGKKITVSQAITQSCNPFFYQLAYDMGIDLISESMHDFGFGQSTGIDIEEELNGIMPSRTWKKNKIHGDWFPGETVLTGIGQGYWNATPLQLANAVATIANGGPRYNLRMVLANEQDGEWLAVNSQLAVRQVDFGDGNNLNLIREAMRRVTKTSWRGTAQKAFNDAKYLSAGKTGTAQLTSDLKDDNDKKIKKSKRHNDNAIYIGYAPFDNPEIAIAVITENGGHGGETAAPVARKIMDAYFNRTKRAETEL